ncbi:MFS general substrate transporter [Podospora australis]|uniref:MFS general substrate transporter n=1 Tax=Podospora australis TaxID=1536484 RepID=A0AAN7AGA3_9PEZI|nr:MFS general substrate transporter [Podospora australis]
MSLGTSVLKTPESSRPGTSAGSSSPDLLSTIDILPKRPEAVHTRSTDSQSTTLPVPINTPEDDPPNKPPFSIFTNLQKHLITLLAAFAAMFSTLSSFIYYPALVPISTDMGISLTLVQLTITSYLIIAGIAPAFMGDMADTSGRRPVYILMFSLVITANIGIALQNSYPALLTLRMVQSAGSSGMYGAAYGVVADIAEAQERGGLVGVLLLMTDVATSLGPVIGGAVTQALGWRWIFWFLVILTGSHFVIMLIFFPETQRKIVGDGSVKPRGWVYQSVFSVLKRRKREVVSVGEKNGHSAVDEVLEQKKTKRGFRFPNPLACLPVLANKGSLAVIVITAINYAVKAALQTSLDAQATEIYGLNYLQAGLVYLPSGVGGGFGSFFAGRFIDWNYKRTVKRLSEANGGKEYDKNSPDFPLERTRLRGVYTLSTITVLGIIGYGLALKFRAHLAVTLTMQLLTGTSTAATFTLCGTLLTDLNMNRSATAQAASNLVRCLSAGGAVAILQPMVERVGPAGCFGIYAGITFVSIPLAWALQTFGVEWRRSQPLVAGI